MLDPPFRPISFTVVLASFVLAIIAGCSSTPNGSPDALPLPLSGAARLGDPFLPSNNRNWNENLTKPPTAEIVGDDVLIHNVRNTTYITEFDFLLNHYDKSFKLSDVVSVDYVLVPFNDASALAHTFVSFGMKDGTYLCVSVEARLERGEVYSPLLGSLRQYELMYLVADERDLILLRTEHRHVDVYLYPTRATPAQAQALLAAMLRRATTLAANPEFYDSVANNCTSNLVRHVNEVTPGRVPYDVRLLLPGYSAELAYDIGLLDTSLPFAELSRRSRITDLAHIYQNSPDFSQKIRER